MSRIDDHLDAFAPPQRAALSATCDVVRGALPGAVETIAYGMPTFTIDGVAVLGLDGFTRHNSLFPYTGSITAEFAAELKDYEQTKGSIHFDRERPFPAPLLKRILRARIREINAAYPKKSGQSKEFYDNGFLKSSGKVTDGHLRGSWTWYRRDGTTKRSGSFRNGVQGGVWTTYDRSGAPHTVTTFP